MGRTDILAQPLQTRTVWIYNRVRYVVVICLSKKSLVNLNLERAGDNRDRLESFASSRPALTNK